MKKCTFCDSELLLSEENESARCWLCGGNTFVDVEEEESRRRQKEKEKKELCCPAPGCSLELLENYKTFCGDCGKPLKRATLDLWIRKCVDPRLKNNASQGVLDKARLFGEAWQMGHSKERAEEALDQYLAEVALSVSQPQQSTASVSPKSHSSIELLLDPCRKDKHDVHTASLTGPRIIAKSFYLRLVAGRSETNNLTHLDFKKSASKEGLRNIDDSLKEVSSHGAFVLFASDENHGWVFPNPKLTFNADSLKPLFAALTADQFANFKEHIEPVPVIRIGNGLWQIEATDNRSLESRGNSAAYTEPKAPEPAKAALVFPVSTAECLAKTQSSSKVVRHDVVRNLLVAGPNGKGELALIRNPSLSKKSDSLFVIPRITSFKSAETFHNLYQRYYDCGWPSAGEVWIIKPAVVSKGQGGWHLLEKGRLEIDFVAKKPPVPYPEPEAVEIKQTEVGKIEQESIPEESLEESFEEPFEESQEEMPIARPLIERRLRLGIGIVASLILLAAIVVAIRRGPSPPVENHSATLSPSPTNMVSISGGEFQMGNNAGDAYEKPAHPAIVKPFLMDTYEVTCEEYLKFVKAKKHRTPSNWIGGQYPDGAAKKPVTGVDWDDATAYASWAGKRLPTEEEWEFAARGTDGRRYPWGNDWQRGAANADGASKGLAEVGSYKNGASLKAYDMIGNAWEWTASPLVPYPGGRLPPQPTGDLKVIRGGSWQSDRASATTTYRWGWPARGGKDYTNTGFRCVKDIPSESRK